MYSLQDTTKVVSFLIQKSPDQSSFATPRSLSQRNTSFIASYRQGIHQMLLTYYFFTRTMPELFQHTEQNIRLPVYQLSRCLIIQYINSSKLRCRVNWPSANFHFWNLAVRAFSRNRQRHMMSEKPIHNFKPQRVF